MNIKLQQQDFSDEELIRCQHDPVYFYNKYVRKEGQREVTQEEYDTILLFAKAYQDGIVLRGRAGIYYPLLPKECFDGDGTKLAPFLKK